MSKMVDAEYVMEALDVSRATVYRVIRELNAELESSGIRTIPGKINLAFFEEKYFALPGRAVCQMSVNRNPKTGLWDVQVWYRTYEGARRKKHRRGFKTKSAGRDWERQFLLRANGSPSMSFADFVGLYKEDVRPLLKLNTFLTKAHILDTKLVPVFDEMKLNEIMIFPIVASRIE